MTHLQRPIPQWPEILSHLPDYSVIKAFDAGVLREAKQKFAALGRDPAKLFTIFRHFADPDPRYFFSTDLAACRAVWRAQIPTYIDRTFLDNYAPYVDMVESLNEHTDTRMVTDRALLALHLTPEQAAVDVWNSDYRGKLLPAHVRLVIVNSPPGNDIPIEFYRLALATDSVLGVHPYSHYEGGVHDAGDWQFHCGRWAFEEQRYGLKPLWAFTECGIYADSGAGWRDVRTVNGDVGRYVAGMRWWYNLLATTAAYREGRLMGPGCIFTSGGGDVWKQFETDTAQLTLIADEVRPIWRPGVLAPPAPAKARGIDVSSHQLPHTMRWPEWKVFGYVYAAARASIGLNTDMAYLEHHRRQRKSGLLTASYHALHESAPMAAQCRLFIRTLAQDDELPPWADIERPGLTRAMVNEWFDVWEAETGGRPIWIYTSGTTWNAIMGTNATRYSRYGLVVADYGPGAIGSEPPVGVGLPRKPAIWLAYEFWQYAGDNGRLPGYAGGIDLSQYTGTAEVLRTRFMTPIGDDEMTIEKARQHIVAAETELALARTELPQFRIKIIVPVLNIRSGPAATFTDIGDALLDQQFDVWEVAPNGWLRIDPTIQKWVSGAITYSVHV